MFREALQKSVIPAKAGIQDFKCRDKSTSDWIPAFAGMTPAGLLQSLLSGISIQGGYPMGKWFFNSMVLNCFVPFVFFVDHFFKA